MLAASPEHVDGDGELIESTMQGLMSVDCDDTRYSLAPPHVRTCWMKMWTCHSSLLTVVSVVRRLVVINAVTQEFKVEHLYCCSAMHWKCYYLERFSNYC